MDKTPAQITSEPAARIVAAIVLGLGMAFLCLPLLGLPEIMGRFRFLSYPELTGIVGTNFSDSDFPFGIFAAYFFILGLLASLQFTRIFGKPTLVEKFLLLPCFGLLVLGMSIFLALLLVASRGGSPDRFAFEPLFTSALSTICWCGIVSLSAAGVIAGEHIACSAHRLQSLKQSLKAGFVAATMVSILAIVFQFVLPRWTSVGDLSFMNTGAIKVENPWATTDPTTTPPVFLHQLTIHNKGGIDLKNLTIVLSFYDWGDGRDTDLLKVFNLRHELDCESAPEDFMDLKRDPEVSTIAFKYGLFRAGDSDKVTFFTDSSTRYWLDAVANGATVHRHWLYEARAAKTIPWIFLCAFLGAVLGNVCFWMKAPAPGMKSNSPDVPQSPE